MIYDWKASGFQNVRHGGLGNCFETAHLLAPPIPGCILLKILFWNQKKYRRPLYFRSQDIGIGELLGNFFTRHPGLDQNPIKLAGLCLRQHLVIQDKCFGFGINGFIHLGKILYQGIHLQDLFSHQRHRRYQAFRYGCFPGRLNIAAMNLTRSNDDKGFILHLLIGISRNRRWQHQGHRYCKNPPIPFEWHPAHFLLQFCQNG